jgi:hypothetical protein
VANYIVGTDAKASNEHNIQKLTEQKRVN